MISDNSASGCITSGEHNFKEGTSLAGLSNVITGDDEAAGFRVGLGGGTGVSVGTIETGCSTGVAEGEGITESVDPKVELQADDAINRRRKNRPTQARIGLIINQTCLVKNSQVSCQIAGNAL